MSKKINDVAKDETSVDFEKRKFMGKFGKYAIGAGMATLMTPTLSTAGNYQSPDDNSVHYPTSYNHGGDNWRDDEPEREPDGEGGFVPPGQT